VAPAGVIKVIMAGKRIRQPARDRSGRVLQVMAGRVGE